MLCGVCGKEQFLVLRRYQGIKIRPKRCLGCIVRFPPYGIILATKDGSESKLRPVRNGLKHHAWVLIKQTSKSDIWHCPYCKATLLSNKLGMPTTVGCVARKAKKYEFTSGFWASLRVKPVLCPLCSRPADIVSVQRIVRNRPDKWYFPFTCRCFR